MWDRSAGHRRCPWKHSLAVLQWRVLPAPVPSPKPAGCLAGASEGLIPNPFTPWELGFGLTSAAGPEPAPIPALLTGEAARIHLERGTWRGAPQPLHASWGAGTRAARSRGGSCCSTPGSRRMLPRDIPGWWRKSPPLPPSPFPSHHQSSLAALSCGLSHILVTTTKKKKEKKEKYCSNNNNYNNNSGCLHSSLCRAADPWLALSLFGDVQAVFKLHGRSSCTKGE